MIADSLTIFLLKPQQHECDKFNAAYLKALQNNKDMATDCQPAFAVVR